MRRSLLFIPSNSPRMVQNCDVFGSDGIIFDLEDAVSISEKDSALELLKNALDCFNFECEIAVRINPSATSFYKANLDFALNHEKINTIVVPMSEYQTVLEVSKAIGKSSKSIIALIETAKGVEEAYEIAKIDGVKALFLGGEDLAVDYGVTRTKESNEIFYARTRLVNASKAAKIECIDTPFTDVEDFEGLRKDTLFALGLGFTGRVAINPRQVSTINEIFSPTEQEIKRAKNIVFAYEEAQKQGLGVFSYNGKMIDAPVLKQAQLTIEKALKLKLI